MLIGNVSGSPAEAPPQGVEMLASGMPAPNTLFGGPNGIPASLGDFGGKTVILNVWATWCAPCIEEMPALDRLAAKLDAGTAIVLTVSQDKGGSAVAKLFLDKLGTKNLVAYDDPSGKLSRIFGIRGLPTTFIIAPNGVVIARVEGSLEWDREDILKFLEKVN